MPLLWFKDFNLGNVFAVRRLKRLTKNGRKQRSSTTTYHEGDHSIPADISMQPSYLAMDPGLQVSTNVTVSSATSSRVESFARTASDMAQTFLPVVQAVAGAIPLAGSPIQATISGLLSILQAIDRRSQNKVDLDRLKSRLNRLSSHLCNAPTAQDPSEQYRRDSIIRMLQDISAQATQLCNRGLAYTSVTQAIVGCSSEIDRYLADYSWSSQIHTRNDIHEIRKTLVRHEEILMSFGIPGQSSVGSIVTLGFVTLVDATNRSHTIPMDVCDSFERFNEQLQLLFKRNTIQAQIQRQYMEQGQYDLCIDDDKQVIPLTSREWPSIEAGTKIVMRVVFEQQTSFRVDYRCHFCGAVNDVGVGSIVDSLQRQAGCSINCRQCKRRFQISRPRNSAKRSTQSSVPRTEAEMYIQNFHIQQIDAGRAAGSLVYVCPMCDRGFTTSGHLARHLRVHTGERNHKCPFPGCETRCSRQDNLQQHYRIHLSPGSRRSSSSATRAAIARAVGTSGSGTKNSRTAPSLISSERNSSDTSSPPPALEHAIPPAPDSPPPLVQAFPVPSYSDSLHSGSVSSRSPTPPENSFPSMINQHSQAMSNGQVASHSSPIQSHYSDSTPGYDDSSQANYGYVTANVSQPSSGHAVHDHSYDYSQAYGEKPSMSRIHSSSLHQSPMENIHDGSPQSSAHLSSVSSRLSISHISHPHSYPTHYQAVSTPSPESPHSVSPHSQLSTPNYSAYRDDSHDVASYQNGSGILDSVPDHSSNYMNTQNNVVHGSYGHTLMSHHSSIPRYDSPPPVLAPIQDERVLRGDIRIPQMHHSITPPASLSYMHHSQVQSSYPYHAPHVGLGQGAWKADNALRARPSTGYV